MKEQEAYDKGYKQGYADRIEMERALRVEDCISRQAVINEIANTNFWLSASNWEELMKAINDTPSVKPTRAKGYNCNEDYAECDQFVCSKCGIELQDWHRVERDDDDSDISYHEYVFNFCPNCGAEMGVIG